MFNLDMAIIKPEGSNIGVEGWVVAEACKPKKVISTTTNWRAIIITGLVFFFSGIENAFVASEWPYMHTIDPDATYAFYGAALSISNWGNVVFSMLFSVWCYKFHTVKWPLFTGRALAFVGSSLYVCVELFPTNRRYVMLTCYVIFGVAKSCVVVLRVYMILISSEEDRCRAFALISLANMISMVVGPFFQLIFSGISYPGFELLPSIRFNLFTAPIWSATVVNFFTIFLVFFGLPEMPRKPKKNPGSTVSLTAMGILKDRWATIKSLNIAWILVFAILLARMSIAFSLSTLPSVISAVFITNFGWDNVTTVQWISIGMGAVGLISIAVGLFFATGFINKFIQSRSQMLIAFVITVSMYFVSFPWPFVSSPVPRYNETIKTGCNPMEYSWCFSSQAPSPLVFLPIVLTSVGFALPTATISLDTLYSKVVGDANQSLMQGLAVFIDDIVAIAGPLYSSQIFTFAGQSALWLSNGLIALTGTIVWIGVFKKLKDY